MTDLKLPATLLHAHANACRDQWVLQMQASVQSTACVVDASELLEFDSSVLAVLLAVRRQALASGQAFQVQHMPEKLLALAGLYGVSGLLTT